MIIGSLEIDILECILYVKEICNKLNLQRSECNITNILNNHLNSKKINELDDDSSNLKYTRFESSNYFPISIINTKFNFN